MRGNLLIFALLLFYPTFGQISQPKVHYIRVNEALFEGRIDTQFIQLYIQKISGPSRIQDYTVLEGWYRKMNDTQRVYLKGISSSDEFMLFSGEAYRDTLDRLIDRDFEDYYNEEYIDGWAILNDPDFDQFEIRLNQQRGNCYWQKGAERRPLILDYQQSKINYYAEFLKYNHDEAINLLELGMYHKGFSVVAWSTRTVLLNYFYDSNPWNPMGRCGAGFESGLCILHFDADGVYSHYEEFPIESCNTGVYSEYRIGENQFTLKAIRGDQVDSLSIDLLPYGISPQTFKDSLRFDY